MIRKAPVNGCLLYNSPNIAVHSGCCGHVELLLLDTVLQFALWAPLLGSLSSSIFFSPLVFFMLHEFCLSTYNQCLSNNFLLMDSNPCCTFFHFLYICFIWNDIYFIWPSQWQCRDSKVCTCQQVKLIPLFALTIMGSKSNVRLTEENCLWSERGPVSISVHVNSLHHWKRKVQICVLCCDKCFYLSHQSPSFLLSFPFYAAKVKGRRTGRSRYLCTTKSAATGWETTSISTCTSAPRRVETGGSTLHTKSPLTVRNPPFLFPCFP